MSTVASIAFCRHKTHTQNRKMFPITVRSSNSSCSPIFWVWCDISIRWMNFSEWNQSRRVYSDAHKILSQTSVYLCPRLSSIHKNEPRRCASGKLCASESCGDLSTPESNKVDVIIHSIPFNAFSIRCVCVAYVLQCSAFGISLIVDGVPQHVHIFVIVILYVWGK